MRLADIIQTEKVQRPEKVGLTDRRRKAYEREQRRLARVDAARLSVLSAEDQMFAKLLNVPVERAARVKMAQDLRLTASGRKRSTKEVAALMGLSSRTLAQYVSEPEKATGGSTAKGTARVLHPVTVANRLRLDAPRVEHESRGQIIKRRRRTRGITQVVLAQMLKLDREQIQAWERDDPEPPIGSYIEIMRALDPPTTNNKKRRRKQ